MNIAIVGFDREGRASYDYFTARGDTVTVCDQKTDTSVPDGVESQLGERYLDNLDRFDVIIRTPGLHPQKILDKNPAVEAKITSGTNEFFKACPTKNIIGITGTKGKGTTSTLVTKMLEAAGKTVHLGGNIGIPALSFVHDIQPDDWVVLELSSFQLMDIKYSPHIAACLMITPEHQDWHEDFGDYIAAKKNLFRFQKNDDITIYLAGEQGSKNIVSVSHGQKIPYYTRPGAYIDNENICINDQIICSVSAIKLLGKHNWQNICAAVTIMWQVAQDIDAAQSVATTFTGLPHRLEFIRENNGITYYDDSFGTTPETAIVAIKSLPEPKILIVGGSDKGSSYRELARVIATENVRAVIVIGETGATIKSDLVNIGYTEVFEGGTTMQEILRAANAHAYPGDTVLLSTASASFGMFKDYIDRGQQFKQVVLSLS